MKESINVHGIKTWNDVKKLKEGIVVLEGVIACQIDKKQALINIVYDDTILDLERIKDRIEDLGY